MEEKKIIITIKKDEPRDMACTVKMDDGKTVEQHIFIEEGYDRTIDRNEFILHAMAQALGFEPSVVLNLSICDTENFQNIDTTGTRVDFYPNGVPADDEEDE